METKFTTHTRKIGNSLFALIPQNVTSLLDIKEDDLVDVLIQNLTIHMIEYKCSACEHEFTLDNQTDPYCPACDCNDIKIIEGSISNDI